MLSWRNLPGRRLSLTVSFAVLLVAAFGAGCRGFFTKPVLQSIAINPTAPQVNVAQTQTLTAYGTFDDGTRQLLSSGVSWGSSDTSLATVTGTGSATLLGVAPGTPTITASAQALSGTATATVVGNVSQISVTPLTASVGIGATGVTFTFASTPGPPTFITADNGGTLVITPADGFVTCTVSTDTNSNPAELCSAVQGASTTTPYKLQMTYPSSSTGGTVTSQTATLSVH